MKKRSLYLIAVLIAAFMVASTITVSTAAAAQQRPIDDFLERQGDYCVLDGVYADPCPTQPPFLIVPPVKNFIGLTDPVENIVAAMDYAGLADECAGGTFATDMTGSITERRLADGRAEVHVRLHTENALTFVAEGDFMGTLLFGERLVPDGEDCAMPPAGTEAALGSSLLHVTFINTAVGAPLPDLIQLVFFPETGQEVKKISFHGQADGLLADGTPGRVEIAQTGLANNFFPAERIILRSVGQ